MSEVSQICERVIIINKGRIIAIDTPENLEKKTQEKNVLLLTVEDKNNYMKNLQKDLPEMLECKLIKNNDDGTMQYMIKSDAEIDLRKNLFDILPKNNVTIFELKKAEKSLEDAFITLVDENTEKLAKKQEEEMAKKEQEEKEKADKKSKKKGEAEREKAEKKMQKKDEAIKEKSQKKVAKAEKNIKEEEKKEQKTNKNKGGKK